MCSIKIEKILWMDAFLKYVYKVLMTVIAWHRLDVYSMLGVRRLRKFDPCLCRCLSNSEFTISSTTKLRYPRIRRNENTEFFDVTRAMPWRAVYTMTQILSVTRAGLRSQCNLSWSKGVICQQSTLLAYVEGISNSFRSRRLKRQ